MDEAPGPGVVDPDAVFVHWKAAEVFPGKRVKLCRRKRPCGLLRLNQVAQLEEYRIEDLKRPSSIFDEACKSLTVCFFAQPKQTRAVAARTARCRDEPISDARLANRSSSDGHLIMRNWQEPAPFQAGAK